MHTLTRTSELCKWIINLSRQVCGILKARLGSVLCHISGKHVTGKCCIHDTHVPYSHVDPHQYLAVGVEPVIDKAKTLDPTRHLPGPECYFLPCLWHHTLEANRKWYACNFYRESCGLHISRIRERERHLGTPCHRQNVAMRIQSLHMLGGIWVKKKVLTEDRSKTFPEWKRDRLQWRHLVVQHPNVRGHLSATDLPKVVRKSTGLQCRKEAWKSESAHTHIHMRVFKLFVFRFFFFNNFSVVFLHL